MKGARKARRHATISADVDTVHSVCRMPRAVKRRIGGERPDCPYVDALQFQSIPGANAIRIILRARFTSVYGLIERG
jgi:hypothetical protein